jgi:hypothetical protein
VAEQLESLLEAGGGALVVPRLLLHDTEVTQATGFANPVADVTEQGQGVLEAGSCGRVVPRLLLHDAQLMQSPGPTSPVSKIVVAQ